MLAKTHIMLGNTYVGSISIDSAGIHGDGGALAPILIVPATLGLDQRPAAERLAVTRIETRLSVAYPQNQHRQLGAPVVVFGDGQGQGIWHSAETHGFETTFELRFPLTPEMLRLIEDAVHQPTTSALGLKLDLIPALAWVRAIESPDFSALRGFQNSAVELLPLAWPRSESLELRISTEQWVTLLSKLGLAELRLVAVRLPACADLDSKLVQVFDEAVAKYEHRNYRGAIQDCRDIRNLVEHSLGATSSEPVALKIAADRGVDPGLAPIKFFDDAWKIFADATNNAHHKDSVGTYCAADARAVLLLTSTLLEYVASSLRRTL